MRILIVVTASLCMSLYSADGFNFDLTGIDDALGQFAPKSSVPAFDLGDADSLLGNLAALESRAPCASPVPIVIEQSEKPARPRAIVPSLRLSSQSKTHHSTTHKSIAHSFDMTQLLMRGIDYADMDQIKAAIKAGVTITDDHIAKNHELFLTANLESEKSWRFCLMGILELEAAEQELKRSLRAAAKPYSPRLALQKTTPSVILAFFNEEKALLREFRQSNRAARASSSSTTTTTGSR